MTTDASSSDGAEFSYLTAQSAEMDGITRLREAAANPGYVQPIGGQVSSYQRVWSTCIHEAGHAVALILAGREIKRISLHLFGGPKLGACFEARPSRSWSETAAVLGVTNTARYIATTFAGPVAELRESPATVFDGMSEDMERASAIDNFLFSFTDKEEDWEGAGWAEACRMMSDDAVWSATVAVAERLNASRALTPSVSGNAIRSIVRRHCPGGWDWSRLFAEDAS